MTAKMADCELAAGAPCDSKGVNGSKARTEYEIECINSTDESYHFVIYVAYPFHRMDTVAWQVVGVPCKGDFPSRSRLSWSLEYGVAIANWDKNEEQYSVGQTIDAQAGIVYEVSTTEEDILVITQTARKAATGMFWLINTTNRPLLLGFTIGGRLVVVERVVGGETFMYKMPSTYWVLCIRNRPMKEGQVLDTSLALGPVQVQFGNGYTKCKVEASNNNGKYILNRPEFCM